MAFEEEAEEIIEKCKDFLKELSKSEHEKLVKIIANYLDDLVAEEVETALENQEPQFDWSDLD